MKIALIHHSLGHKKFSENLKLVDEEFCLAPPIGLAYVAAILEKHGHRVIIIDANALKLSKDKVLGLINEFSPDIIGFRADTYWFHRTREWAEYFKKNTSAKIIVGGINISLYPRESLSYDCFDYGIIGEANESLPKLISRLESGGCLDDLPGIVHKKNGEIFFSKPSDEIIDFDSYPFPARHLLPNQLYHSFTSQLKNYTIMVTSLGCPFKCSFCAIVRIKYRERSADNVINEIEECYKKFGVREIDFFDANFFVNKSRVIEICQGILRKGLKIEWSCRSRVDIVDDEVLKLSSLAGCRKIYYGIESASQKVLGDINKNINRDQTVRAVELTRKYGIGALGFFMVGNISDSKESILASIDFAKELKLDFIQVCRTIAKPNTELNDRLISSTGIDYWREYILGKRSEMRLPNPWSQLSEQEIEKYVKKFYKDFYFRIFYVLRRILKIKSLSELFRYMRAALKWAFFNPSDLKKEA